MPDAMLEGATRRYFEDILGTGLVHIGCGDYFRVKARPELPCAADDSRRSFGERIMTRKTRTRRPRIPAIRSGYCAVCHVPYNSVEDHVQSKKHVKLVGDDAAYIALNGPLNGFLDADIPFLNLSGIDHVDKVHETSLEDFSSKFSSKAMPRLPRTRASSVAPENLAKPSQLSPAGSDVTGHHLRSRRSVNYASSLDEDSQPEKTTEAEPFEFKEYRELRSSTRALAKLTEQLNDNHVEVWNSGRPKRACIKQKLLSTEDQRLPSSDGSFYKVEVISSKLRSTGAQNSRECEQPKRRSQWNDDKDKGLIVKFKKMRNSELVRLNNEATNFLFPKKDDDESSDEDEDGNETEADCESAGSILSSTVKEECAGVSVSNSSACGNANAASFSRNFKAEDDASMDSSCSETKTRKRRRTHAEAFIMDNQKYYKFETPGSRLRYHGTYLPSVMKSPKHNGDCAQADDSPETKHEPEQKVIKLAESPTSKINLDGYKFSFEQILRNRARFNTLQRRDSGSERFGDNFYWDEFVLPYQMPFITPLDPKVCIDEYNRLVEQLRDYFSEHSSDSATPATSTSASPPSADQNDDDSKPSSAGSLEEARPVERRKRGGRGPARSFGQGKNPRKSPRQHASTLAILSSLLHQRKRRSKNKSETLPMIPEEKAAESGRDVKKAKSPWHARRSKPKVDYFALAREIDEEFNTAFDDDLEDLLLDEPEGEDNVFEVKTNFNDVLRLYDESGSKFCVKPLQCFKERFASTKSTGGSGLVAKKPGRRKKKNKTGWPKNKKLLKKEKLSTFKDEDFDESTMDSVSGNLDSEEEEDEDANSVEAELKPEEFELQTGEDETKNLETDTRGLENEPKASKNVCKMLRNDESESRVLKNESKTSKNDFKTVENKSKTFKNESKALEKSKTMENESKTLENKSKTLKNDLKGLEKSKTMENKVKTSKNESKALEKFKTMENESKTLENKSKTSKNELKALEKSKTMENESKNLENKEKTLKNESKALEKSKTMENESKNLENKEKTLKNESKALEKSKTMENESKILENKVKTLKNESKALEKSKTLENESKTLENKIKTSKNESKAFDNSKTMEHNLETMEIETKSLKKECKILKNDSKIEAIESNNLLQNDLNISETEEKSEETDLKTKDIHSDAKTEKKISETQVISEEKTENVADKVLTNKISNGAELQPYVCVQKLASEKILNDLQRGSPRRMGRRQRRMPGSPRTLRKPRGRWYRER